jgi:hypothetical protein
LGLNAASDPLSAILEFCRARIRGIAAEFGCKTLEALLDAAAAAVGTCFVEITSDNDLREVRDRYLNQGEKAFATLCDDLRPDVLAITFRLTKRKKWQSAYVSIIDCRGEKALRAYYSKWHELAHILTLTDQMRLVFTRTHAQSADSRDPEEALMEVIAGEIGFFDQLVRGDACEEISFELIDKLRAKHCPSASWISSLIGFVNAWPSACFLITADLGFKKREAESLTQDSFAFARKPVPELRALRVSPNAAARRTGVRIHTNMRVPHQSVIFRAFSRDIAEGQAVENLSWWTTSEGERLADQTIMVKVRRFQDGVRALILPL